MSGLPKPTLREGTVSVTWEEYGHMVAEVMLFLQSKGLQSGDRVAALSWNSLDWMVLNRAATILGLIVVPLYPNTTSDQIAHVLNDSEAKLVIVESEKLNSLIDANLLKKPANTVMFAEVMQNVPNLVAECSASQACFDRSTSAWKRFDQFALLKAHYIEPNSDILDNISTLIYTSGSTGMPKGAVLTNRNISAACELLATLGFGFGPGDINLHYLPFAHIYGKAVGMELAEYMGLTSAFALPTDLQTAVPLYRPTVLFGVPRVWNRYRAEIEKQAAERGLKAGVLRWALSRKEGTVGRWMAKKFVFPGIRKKLGMDLTRVLVTGSAAIPPETTAFFLMLGLELREGYGATETTGGIFANTLTEYKFGSLGKPGVGIETRIEARQGIDTEPNTGVLYVRGAPIFPGYWNLPAKNSGSSRCRWLVQHRRHRAHGQRWIRLVPRSH